MNLEKAKQKLDQYQQSHLLRYYDELNDAQKAPLHRNLHYSYRI